MYISSSVIDERLESIVIRKGTDPDTPTLKIELVSDDVDDTIFTTVHYPGKPIDLTIDDTVLVWDGKTIRSATDDNETEKEN